MRIAFYSDIFYPELSGITDSIVTVSRELAKLDHKIAFFVPHYSKKAYEVLDLPYEEIEIHPNVEIHRVMSFFYPTGTKQSRMVVPTGTRVFLLKKFNPDIVHTHLITGMGIEGLIDAKLLKKPLVGTNHTPIEEFLRYVPIHTAWAKKFVTKYDEWYYNQCDFVTSPSHPVLEKMKELGLKKSSVAISNPLNLDFFMIDTPKKTLKRKLGLSDFTILYTGRIAQEKNIDMVIKAVAKLKDKIPNITMALTGKGDQEEFLKNLTRELGIEDKVKFFGFIKKGDVKFAEIYNAADVFAIMSTCETQCIAAMQSMGCGSPVLAAKSWGLKEYVNEQNGFLIEPGNVDQLAEKILYLYENPKERIKLGIGAKKFVDKFSAKNIAKKWEEIYQKVLKDHHRLD